MTAVMPDAVNGCGAVSTEGRVDPGLGTTG